MIQVFRNTTATTLDFYVISAGIVYATDGLGSIYIHSKVQFLMLFINGQLIRIVDLLKDCICQKLGDVIVNTDNRLQNEYKYF